MARIFLVALVFAVLPFESWSQQGAPLAPAYRQAGDGKTKVPVFKSPPRPIVLQAPRLTREQQESAALIRKQEQARKAEDRRQEQQRKAEKLKQDQAQQHEELMRQKQQRAEAAELERERRKNEQIEKARVEKQVKLWSKPVTPEEAARYKKLTEERLLYMEKQRGLQKESARDQESGCVVTPVMTDEQIAKCR
jgi:hypothetical protein